jgi:hypothetical protein
MESAAAYADLRSQLHLESLAALSLLTEAGATEALILLSHLAGQKAVRSVIGAVVSDQESACEEGISSDELRAAIAPSMRMAILDPERVEDEFARKVLLEAAAARRKVNRAGFRVQDAADPEMIVALRSGSTMVFEVIADLDRLTATLSKELPMSDIAEDSQRFHAAFKSIYLSGPQE